VEFIGRVLEFYRESQQEETQCPWREEIIVMSIETRNSSSPVTMTIGPTRRAKIRTDEAGTPRYENALSCKEGALREVDKNIPNHEHSTTITP
jgi:hypothetical protein